MSTFILQLDAPGDGPRLAVKDLIDVAGVPTTAGCRAVARTAAPAAADAACLNGARAAGARIVGKTNLHELAVFPFGTNPWFGTPVNPLDPALVPGGSSSGSAVAVANDDADVALGTDTGGSVRIPAACCGVVGLKTTHGRIPCTGVWPLAPSLDTVGPLARDVAGVRLGMELLEPGFRAGPPARRIGRLRTVGDPAIEAAVDAALRQAGLDVVDVELDLASGAECFTAIYFAELWDADHRLLEADPEGVGPDVAEAIRMAPLFAPGAEDARRRVPAWRESLRALFDAVELLALPTLPIAPPRLDALTGDLLPLVIDLTRHTSPFNAAGVPCSAQPVPCPGSAVPASLQLVGPHGAEERLVATAALIEAALS